MWTCEVLGKLDYSMSAEPLKPAPSKCLLEHEENQYLYGTRQAYHETLVLAIVVVRRKYSKLPGYDLGVSLPRYGTVNP